MDVFNHILRVASLALGISHGSSHRNEVTPGDMGEGMGKWANRNPQNITTKSEPLRWRHNDHDSVSNHQPLGCLLNRLFRRRSKKTSKLRVTGLCVGNSPGPVNSPHKGPVTRKMFPFDDVIMRVHYLGTYSTIVACLIMPHFTQSRWHPCMPLAKVTRMDAEPLLKLVCGWVITVYNSCKYNYLPTP